MHTGAGLPTFRRDVAVYLATRHNGPTRVMLSPLFLAAAPREESKATIARWTATYTGIFVLACRLIFNMHLHALYLEDSTPVSCCAGSPEPATDLQWAAPPTRLSPPGVCERPSFCGMPPRERTTQRAQAVTISPKKRLRPTPTASGPSSLRRWRNLQGQLMRVSNQYLGSDAITDNCNVDDNPDSGRLRLPGCSNLTRRIPITSSHTRA